MNDLAIRGVFLLHLATTLFMMGIIWLVQMVHYPLFERVGLTEFLRYEQEHTRLTGWVVAPPMVIELGTGLALIWFRPWGISNVQVGIGLGLLTLIWLSTIFVQMRCHERLMRGFDPVVQRRLVLSNWLRTVAWSLRALLVLWMTWSVLSGVDHA